MNRYYFERSSLWLKFSNQLFSSATKALLAFYLVFYLGSLSSFAQPNFTNADYQKVLWMTTRFYGAQRSGSNNWVLAGHLPSGANAALTGTAFRNDRHTDGTDLSGGWHDCGDHVKFGQTQFYSAYLVIKGYAEFPQGYDDRYSFTYNGYRTSNQWDFEGNGHDPNCIPDILDEMKHETDYLIKITPNGSNFYWQVGNGGGSADHATWTTATQMQRQSVNQGGNNDNGVTSGPYRPACKNPADASMPSFAGATLACMARVYKKFDAAYAATCLTHALNAYAYAKANPGTTGTCFGNFYFADRGWKAAFASLCAELFWTTGNAAYRTEALSYSDADMDINVGYTFDYGNNGEIGMYNLARLGRASSITAFNNRITGHFLAAGSRNANGVYTAQGTWGRLRYNGNAAFLISLYSKLNNNTTAAVIKAIHDDVDYIMGKNSSKRTYVVGFAPAAGGPYTTVQYPHHRSVYLRDDNPGNAVVLTIPAKNRQLGALVGGQRDGTYNDDRNDYVNSEVCIDYNAGLVGALGFVNQRLAPVDTNKFCGNSKCKDPNLGPELSTCAGTTLPLTLQSNTTQPSGVIFTWYRNGAVISGQTGPNCTNCATVAGNYVVVRDSASGTCKAQDTLNISNSIPTPDLGADQLLCTASSINLSPANVASFPGSTTYTWWVDETGGTTYTSVPSVTGSTYASVRTRGRYRIVASAGACTSEDNVVITSNLPKPVDGCRNTAGSVAMSISNPGLNGTNYNWYSAPTGGTLICSNTITCNSPSIASSAFYYVQDMSAINTTVGPTTLFGTSTNWGVNSGNQLSFTASSNFDILSMDVPFLIYGNGSGTITIEILDGSGNPFTPAKTFTSDASNITTGQNGQLITFNFTGLTIQSSWGTNLRMRLSAESVNGDPVWSSGGASYPYSVAGVVSITGEVGGSGSNDYMYFYDWQISTGTNCARLPVQAKIGSCPAVTPVDFMSLQATLKNGNVHLKWTTSYEKGNEKFVIERSADGFNYKVIGELKGTNNTTNLVDYTFTDKSVDYGYAYYRVVNFDFDGKSNASQWVFVNTSQTDLKVYPNPSKGIYYVKATKDNLPIVKLSVYDIFGKEIYNDKPQLSETAVDLSAQSPGLYFLTVEYGDNIETLKLIKE